MEWVDFQGSWSFSDGGQKVLVEVFGLYETKQGENKPGAEKKKLVVHSPFVWKNKGEF